MIPQIETLNEKKLIGKRLLMSLADNKTAQLWQSFMPQRHLITHRLNSHVISMQVYNPDYFAHFSPHNKFEKWACVEVSDFTEVPPDMETFVLPAGMYAVFHYQGLSSDNSIFQYIFATWLPASAHTYALDHRPHFEVLGEKYKNNDPTSEEDIWIPIKPLLPRSQA
ncbi:MAG: GyrI-like domain-containing protein [Bacteroidota bacterium]